MFDHMDGMTRALAKKKTQWREDLFIEVKFASQKRPIYYAEVTPTMGMHLISAHILNPFPKLRSFRKWDKGMDINLWTRHPILPNTKRPFRSMWRMNTAPNIEACLSLNSKSYRTAFPSPLQWLQDPVIHPLIHMICPAMMKDTSHLTMWLRRHRDESIALPAY
jgi:hypothetical protein